VLQPQQLGQKGVHGSGGSGGEWAKPGSGKSDLGPGKMGWWTRWVVWPRIGLQGARVQVTRIFRFLTRDHRWDRGGWRVAMAYQGLGIQGNSGRRDCC